MRERLEFAGLQAERQQPVAKALDVIDGERDVTVACAVRVGRRGGLVQRELDLGAALRLAEVDEGEIAEIETMRFGHAEGTAVEPDRAIEICDADHQVDEFW